MVYNWFAFHLLSHPSSFLNKWRRLEKDLERMEMKWGIERREGGIKCWLVTNNNNPVTLNETRDREIRFKVCIWYKSRKKRSLFSEEENWRRDLWVTEKFSQPIGGRICSQAVWKHWYSKGFAIKYYISGKERKKSNGKEYWMKKLEIKKSRRKMWDEWRRRWVTWCDGDCWMSLAANNLATRSLTWWSD